MIENDSTADIRHGSKRSCAQLSLRTGASRQHRTTATSIS